MALPWLIGAAVLGLGAALASSDSSSSSSDDDYDYEKEKRHREREAERERKERERQQAISSLINNFNQEGKTRAKDIVNTLDDVLVIYDRLPTFKAKLGSFSFSLDQGNKNLIPANISPHLDTITAKNLEFFSKVYSVNSLNTAKQIEEKIQTIAEIESALNQLDAKKKKLKNLQKMLNKN